MPVETHNAEQCKWQVNVDIFQKICFLFYNLSFLIKVNTGYDERMT